jgi:hypothetical protein
MGYYRGAADELGGAATLLRMIDTPPVNAGATAS